MAAVSGTEGKGLGKVRVVEGDKPCLKQAQAREQLNTVIEKLSAAQVRVLLLQALQLMEGGCNVQSKAIAALSKRELEVLALVARGNNRRDIGNTLGISAHTAARHIANIYAKLGISTVAEAASIAFHSNLVDASQRLNNGVALQQ